MMWDKEWMINTIQKTAENSLEIKIYGKIAKCFYQA